MAYDAHRPSAPDLAGAATGLGRARVRWLAAGAALALGAALAPAASAAPPGDRPGKPGKACAPAFAAERSDTVNDPTVIGPIGDEGIRTRRPYGTTMVPLPAGWVEEEFFLDGTARDYPTGTAAPREEAYRTRIMIRRPADPKEFNGTVIVDWNNVTIPHDRDVAWAPIYPTVLERGFAYMSVGAQRLGIEASPLAVKNYDPVRYGSLNHPGDDWSFDIFSQAAEAALDRKVMGNLAPCVQRRIGMGASQSGSRLLTYINRVQEQAGVFDAFTPQISGSGNVRRDVVPIVWVNSTAEAANVPADSGLFRLWELAGAAHTSNQSSSYQDEMLVFSHSNGNAGKWDPEAAGAWGYLSRPGDCLTRNYYQAGFIWAAAVVAVDDWVRTGIAPPSQPRIERTADGTDEVFDEHGNAKGGVRGPLVDAPIASYYAGVTSPPGNHPCARAGGASALSGTTHVFDAAKLKALYPTQDAYLQRFDAGVQQALEAGTLLREGVEPLRRRARLAAAWIGANTGA
jgi:hypothetical protein